MAVELTVLLPALAAAAVLIVLLLHSSCRTFRLFAEGRQSHRAEGRLDACLCLTRSAAFALRLLHEQDQPDLAQHRRRRL